MTFLSLYRELFRQVADANAASTSENMLILVKKTREKNAPNGINVKWPKIL